MHKIHHDTRIFMDKIAEFDKTTNTIYTKKPAYVFENAAALITFLAKHTRLTYHKTYSCIYIEEQNLTGTDLTAIHESRMTNDGLYTETHYILKPYWFHDKNNTTIDIRKFLPDVIRQLQSRTKTPYVIPAPMHTKTHTACRIKKETYVQTIKHNYTENYETDDTIITIPYRKTDNSHSSISRHSTGWKSKKHKKQWMHNQIEKDKHTANKIRKKGCTYIQP